VLFFLPRLSGRILAHQLNAGWGQWWVSAMNIVLNRAVQTLPTAEWRDSKSYSWITTLPRRAIAWEFLRRSPSYREAYFAQQDQKADDRSDWPMVRLRRSDVGRPSSGPGLDENSL
jgi:hypothetical protein